MWLQFDNKQLDLLESALSYRASEIRKGLNELNPKAVGPRERLTEKAASHEVLLDRIRERRVIGENDDAYRNAAKNEANDELEVDDDAAVSESDEGAFVMSWTWIDRDQAGLPDEEDNE